MTIQFYVSWYLGDPNYPTYSADCAMLLSPTSLSRQWTLRELPVLPTRLIIDSGGFRYHTSTDPVPTAAELLDRQLAIVGDVTVPTLICPLDSPIGWGSVPSVTVDQHIASTLAHAFELQSLIQRRSLPLNVQPLGVVQGNDDATLRYSVRELSAMGYVHFGVGSLARVPDPHEIARRTATVFELVQRPLHLFGVGSPQVLRQVRPGWVASVDSSAPARAAAFNELFYSQPFRRYGIKNAEGVSCSKLPANRCLARPLDCCCPICRIDSAAILRIGRRKFIRARSVHNYYHMRNAIEALSRS